MSECVKVRLWEIRRTDKARLYSTTPPSSRDGDEVWIPISQIDHVSYQPAVEGEWRECVVTIPEWIADEKGLI